MHDYSGKTGKECKREDDQHASSVDKRAAQGGNHMSVPVKKKRRDPVPGDLWDRGLTPPDLLRILSTAVMQRNRSSAERNQVTY